MTTDERLVLEWWSASINGTSEVWGEGLFRIPLGKYDDTNSITCFPSHWLFLCSSSSHWAQTNRWSLMFWYFIGIPWLFEYFDRHRIVSFASLFANTHSYFANSPRSRWYSNKQREEVSIKYSTWYYHWILSCITEAGYHARHNYCKPSVGSQVEHAGAWIHSWWCTSESLTSMYAALRLLYNIFHSQVLLVRSCSHTHLLLRPCAALYTGIPSLRV